MRGLSSLLVVSTVSLLGLALLIFVFVGTLEIMTGMLLLTLVDEGTLAC